MLWLVLLIAGIACAVLSAVCFGAHTVFHKYPLLTKCTGATLLDYEHRKNVKLLGRGKIFFIKDMAKALYYYEANGKAYKVRYNHYFSKKASKSLPIVYIKSFPRLHYVNKIESFSKSNYLIWGSILAFWAFSLIFLGVLAG